VKFFRFDYSRLTIYFKEDHFLTSHRKEFYGNIDFLADCGGLLGLFLGVSVISLLEIVYFCTVRLGFNLQRGQTSCQDEIKRVETKSKLRVLKDLVADYSTRATIQGINYVADTDRSWMERFWWAVVVVLSVFCCVSLILHTIRRYDQSPVILSYENEETDLFQVKVRTLAHIRPVL